MADTTSYVVVDDNGAMRAGSAGVMLDSIVAAFQQGHSAETIRAQYPVLTLEEVYGALTYCLAHSDKVNAYMRRQEKVWEREHARSEQNVPAVVHRLRAEKEVSLGAK